MDFNRFDVSAKELVWDDPEAWIEGLKIAPPGPVSVIDSDITTLSAAADKVLRVEAANPFLVNIEFQSSHDADLLRTLWFRQVALDYRHALPVLTVLILLRREANSPTLTGVYQRNLPDGQPTNRYDYRVVRLWREDPETFLNAGIGLLPLAPLADIAPDNVPGLIQRMAARIRLEPSGRANILGAATYLLMGLRYDEDWTANLLEGLLPMKESTTYQKILRDGRVEGRVEGRVAEARDLLLLVGGKQFGMAEAPASFLEAIDKVHQRDRLEKIMARLLDPDIQSWGDLLDAMGEIEQD